MTKLIENTGVVLLNNVETAYDSVSEKLAEFELLVVDMKNAWGALNEKAFARQMEERSTDPDKLEDQNRAARKQAGRRLSFLKLRYSVEIAVEKLLYDADERLQPLVLRVKEILDEGRVEDPRLAQIWKLNALLAMKLLYSARAACEDASLFIERSACINPELRQTLNAEFERVYKQDSPEDPLWTYLCR